LEESDPIKLKNLTKIFDGNKVVNELSFSIKENEIVTLLGHNGAGKTTALYMLTGMIQLDGGDATLYENSILTQTEKA
jgi:ABC-type multidrug transport system ATPase subunit